MMREQTIIDQQIGVVRRKQTFEFLWLVGDNHGFFIVGASSTLKDILNARLARK